MKCKLSMQQHERREQGWEQNRLLLSLRTEKARREQPTILDVEFFLRWAKCCTRESYLSHSLSTGIALA